MRRLHSRRAIPWCLAILPLAVCACHPPDEGPATIRSETAAVPVGDVLMMSGELRNVDLDRETVTVLVDGIERILRITDGTIVTDAESPDHMNRVVGLVGIDNARVDVRYRDTPGGLQAISLKVW